MNRRRFLRQAGGAAAGMACGGLTSFATGCLPFHYVAATATAAGIVVRKRDLGTEQFVLVEGPEGQPPIYLYRLEHGSFAALSTRCTHRGCPVEPTAGHLVCPCHGSEYTNTGEVLRGPAERPLTRFAVREDGETLVISWRPDANE